MAAGLSNLLGDGCQAEAIGFRRHFATLPIHVAPSLCARLRVGVSWAPLKGPLHVIHFQTSGAFRSSKFVGRADDEEQAYHDHKQGVEPPEHDAAPALGPETSLVCMRKLVMPQFYRL